MKKYRLLSSLLTALMILSMFTVIPVGAAKIDSTTLFCDFESFDEGTVSQSALKAEGLTSYDTSVGESTRTAQILSDTDGNKAVGVGTATGHLYVAAPSVITTGKAYIGFSVKGDSFANVKAFFEEPRPADTASGTGRYIGSYMAIIEGGVAPANGATSSLTTNLASRDASKWCNVKIVVDLDNNTWTTYLEGKDLGTYSFADVYGIADISAFHGFSFYEGYVSGSGMIDNISIICDPTGKNPGVRLFSSNVTVDDGGNTVITASFSEAIDVTAEDVKVTGCGSTDEIAVADVTALANGLTIRLDGSPDAGREYVVTLDGYEDVEVYVYLEPDSEEISGYCREDFEGTFNTMTFEEPTSSGTATRTVVTDEKVRKILESEDKYNGTVNRVRLMELEQDDDANGTDVEGHVLASLDTGSFYLLDIIESDTGVETYEFDYKWYWSTWNSDKNVRLYMTGGDTIAGAAGKYITTFTNENKWHHLKIEYDTSADILTVTQDGNTEVFDDVPAFDNRLKFGTIGTKNPGFKMDNYVHYVTDSPLNIEKVRYIDNNGKITGANIISPETTQIDISFSKAIDENTINGITLTADGEALEFYPESDGKIVTLTLPGMLPGGADIELAIPGPADTAIYNVSTKAGKFEVSGLSLKLNYETVAAEGTTGPEGDTVVITADVINTAAMGKKLTLVYALYNNCELVDIGFEDVIIENDEYVTSIETDALTTKANVEYDTVKAFVWNGLDRALSQTPAVSYPAP